jgi:predicted lipid-binding transport protein (Tim44 family)
LDGELAAAPGARQVTCTSCGKQQPPGGMICGACGEMLPAPPSVSNRPLPLKPQPAKSEAPSKKSRKRKVKLDFQLGSLGSFIRGTALCIVFTMIGATIWAVVAFLTRMEFGIVAIAMGGLAGYGMVLGHNEDNGLLAGIVAGFITFCGIIGAKILIVVILVAALIAGAAGDLQREILIESMAEEALQQHGGNPANLSLDQRERAVASARSKVDAMDDAQVEAKFAELTAKWEAEAAEEEAAELAVDEVNGDGEDAPMEVEGAGGEVADGEVAGGEAEVPQFPVAANEVQIDPAPAAGNGPGFGGIFRPLDLLFILLAVGTAFRVGSGFGS